jgi:uncharacterized protein
MKTYVLYHAQCPDGFGAATAAWLKLGSEAEYIPVTYGKPMPEMADGSKVFIVDFSYPRQPLLDLAKRMNRVVVLDHHSTAQQDLADLELPGEDSEIQFDMAKSGAVLSWEFFHEEPAPEFILYLQDRDLWTFSLPQSREVSCAVRSYPMDFEVWAEFIGQRDSIKHLRAECVALLRLTNQMVLAMVNHHRRVILDGKHKSVMFLPPAGENEANGFGVTVEPDQWSCPVSNASVFFSEVGEALLNKYPDAPFSAYYSDRSDGKRQWGLRSRPSFDCSVISKAFGGGGHKAASGFVQ